LINIGIILFYFIIFIFSFTAMILFKAFYRKLSKYMFDNCFDSFACSIFMFINWGPYNFLLGAIHYLLLSNTKLQLQLLMGIEIIFFIFQGYFVIKKRFKNSILAVNFMLISLVRIFFQISFYIYN